VVVRRNRYGPECALPKGKLDKGESFEEAAVREIEEETGCRTQLVDLISAIDYRVGKGPKVVLFFETELTEEGRFEPSDEIEAIEWLTPDEALTQLSHPAEQAVLERYLRMRSGGA